MEVFAARGWAAENQGRWAFTPSGFLVSNQLIGALLEVQAGEKVLTNPWMQAAFEKQEKQELPPDDEQIFRSSMENGF